MSSTLANPLRLEIQSAVIAPKDNGTVYIYIALTNNSINDYMAFTKMYIDKRVTFRLGNRINILRIRNANPAGRILLPWIYTPDEAKKLVDSLNTGTEVLEVQPADD